MKPITIHTVESLMAKTIEVGECKEWQGFFQTNKHVPYVYDGTTGKMVAVRKLLALLAGKDVSKVAYWAVNCGNWRCVCPDHTVGRNRQQQFKHMAHSVDHQHPARVAKLQTIARKRAVCKIDEATAQAIRVDPRSSAKVAAAYGISKSQASKIKAGLAWKQVSAAVNPWGGLMR